MLRRALGPLTTRTLLAAPCTLLASALTSITRSCDAGGAAVHEAHTAHGGGRGFTASAAQRWAFPPLPRDLTPPKHSFNQEDKPPGWGRSGGGASPFTHTKDLLKRKSLFKRCAYLMQTLDYEATSAAAALRPAVPAFRAGDVLDIQVAVPDNKDRVTTFRGLVIARYNKGISSSVVLRSVIHDHAVERSFPLYGPQLRSITLVERRHAARAKLFFLRRKPLRDSRVSGGGVVSQGAAGASAATRGASGEAGEPKPGGGKQGGGGGGQKKGGK